MSDIGDIGARVTVIVSNLRQSFCLYSGLALLSLFAGSAAVHAQSASGCQALSVEHVSLGQGQPSSHKAGAVPLATGKLRMRIVAEGESAGRGSIAVSQSGETGAPVIAGAAPQETLFIVPHDGLYALEFSSDGAAPLTFEVLCETTAASLSPSAANPNAFVNRRTGRLLSENWEQLNLNRRGNKPNTLDKAVKHTVAVDEEGNPTNLRVTTSLQNMAAADGRKLANTKFDVWVEGRVSQFEHKFNESGTRYKSPGSASAVNLGADYMLQPGLLVGALAQFDRYNENYDAFSAASSSKGVLFGPYASYRVAPGLVLDAQYAWGDAGTLSELSDGTQTDFETERQLLRGRLTGSRQLLGLQFSPSVALSVVEDRFANPDEFSGEDGAFSGQLGLGSSVSYRYKLDDGGFVQPKAGLSTSWTLESLDAFAIDDGNFSNTGGARAEAGITLGTPDGISINAGGAIEGIGQSNYSGWNGRVSLTAPLN